MFIPTLKAEDLDQQQIEAKRLQKEMQYKEAEKHTVFYQIDQYIKSKEKKVAPDMLRIYRNMKNHVQCFETFRGIPITFKNMDLTFYEEFVEYLTYEYVLGQRKNIVGLKINTIGKTINELRGSCKIEFAKKLLRRSTWKVGRSLRKKPTRC